MTPEDLTAIGIQNPGHRKRLKAEISKLHIGDRLPNHIPGSLEEWLHLVRLQDYLGVLRQQGYTTLNQVSATLQLTQDPNQTVHTLSNTSLCSGCYNQY